MAWPNGLSSRHLLSPRREWRLWGIPIRIDASWFFVVAFVTWSLSSGYFPSNYPGFQRGVYWAMGGVSAVLLFACVLLHELGHSLVAKWYGIPVSRVTLFMFGGVAQIVGEPHRPSIELTVALAGPLVSALIAGACFAAAAAIPLQSPLHLVAAAIVRYLAVINAVLILFNLLPGFPLDGGRVLRAMLWAWTGSLRRATRMASAVGSGLGVGLLALGVWAIVKGAWGGGLWYVLLGFFLRDAALTSYRQAAP